MRRALLVLVCLTALALAPVAEGKAAKAGWAGADIKAVVAAGLMGPSVAEFRSTDALTKGELAALVFRAIGGSGLARCDFFVREDGEVLVNEFNAIPGFTSTSVFARLFEADGIPYPELCDRLVQLALERHEAERAYRF